MSAPVITATGALGFTAKFCGLPLAVFHSAEQLGLWRVKPLVRLPEQSHSVTHTDTHCWSRHTPWAPLECELHSHTEFRVPLEMNTPELPLATPLRHVTQHSHELPEHASSHSPCPPLSQQVTSITSQVRLKQRMPPSALLLLQQSATCITHRGDPAVEAREPNPLLLTHRQSDRLPVQLAPALPPGAPQSRWMPSCPLLTQSQSHTQNVQSP